MSQYVFGRDFTRRFYCVINNQPVNLYTQNPAIYVFSSQPSRTDAAAGTGAVTSCTTWKEQQTRPYAREYTISGIDDPDPTSGLYSYTYWIAVNYKIQSGEQTQTDLRSFDIERAGTLSEIPGTTIEDLIDIYPALEDYVTRPQLNKFIRVAEDQVKADLEAKGFAWAQIVKLDNLRLPLAYKTIALASFSQMKEPGDRFERRFDVFEAWYNNALSGVKLTYDSDRDGLPDTAAQVDQEWIAVR